MGKMRNFNDLLDLIKSKLVGNDEVFFPVDEWQRDLDWPRISSWLKHESYDPVGEYFIIGDHVGIMLEVSPQTGASEATVETLKTMLVNATDGTCFQIQIMADHWIEPILMPYIQSRPLEFRKEAITRVKWWMSIAGSHKEDELRQMRTFRTFISATVPHTTEASVRRITNIRMSIESTLRSAQFGYQRVGPEGFLAIASRLMNPQRFTPDPVQYNNLDEIKNQVVRRDTKLQLHPNEMLFDDGEGEQIAARCYSVNKYPKAFPLWMMHNLLGNYYTPTMTINAPFMLTIGVYVRDPETLRAAAQMKSARATSNAESPMAKILPDLAEKKRDWDLINTQLLAGDEIIKMYHQLVVYTTPENLHNVDQQVKTVYRASGFQLVADRYMQSQAMISSIPMSLTRLLAQDVERAKRWNTCTTHNVINLSPLVAEWAGTGGATLKLYGRRGQVMSLDLFDNTAGNYNCVVAGASGSGKSVMAQEIVAGYYSTGADIRIIDAGRSYLHLCEILDGSFIEFNEEDPICVNPFTWVTNLETDMEMIKPLLSIMASPKEPLSTLEEGMLEMAVKQAYAEHGNKTRVTDIRNVLLSGQLSENHGESDQRVRDLGMMLTPFAEGGQYSRFFDGEATITFDNRLCVLELDSLNGKPDLQSVIMFLMLYYATNQMYHQREQRSLFVIDEAWSLMSGGGSNNTAKFIESAYRRARKYNGSCITITQGIEDYYQNPAANAALQNSDWMVLLRQKTESVEMLKKDGKLALDEGSLRQLLSLRTEHGQYSEAWIKCPLGQGIGRLYLDPYHELLYSTKAEDYSAIKRYQDQGVGVQEAVMKVLEDRGVEI